MFKNSDHYKALSIEPIDFMWANMTKDELRGFFKGNITKYAYRKKGQDLQDAQKIQTYARWLELLYDPSQVDEARALYKLISKVSEADFDYVISVGRGGAYVAAKVAYAFDKPLYVMPTFEDLSSLDASKLVRSIYIDDIEDTSKTIEQAKELQIPHIGVLVQKETSKKLADFVGLKTDYNGYINFTFQEV